MPTVIDQQESAASSLEDMLNALRQKNPESPIVIHVWAEWCSFCRLEEGNISALAEDTPVITVAMQSGDAARVAGYMQDRNLDWPTLVDPQGQLAQALGASGVPTFMVIDSQGDIRTPSMGYTSLWGMRLRLLWTRLTA